MQYTCTPGCTLSCLIWVKVGVAMSNGVATGNQMHHLITHYYEHVNSHLSRLLELNHVTQQSLNECAAATGMSLVARLGFGTYVYSSA